MLGIDAMLEGVRLRGGPSVQWDVDLARQRATVGGVQLSFYVLDGDGFVPLSYRRQDALLPDPVRDQTLLEDGVACIAQTLERNGRRATPALRLGPAPVVGGTTLVLWEQRTAPTVAVMLPLGVARAVLGPLASLRGLRESRRKRRGTVATGPGTRRRGRRHSERLGGSRTPPHEALLRIARPRTLALALGSSGEGATGQGAIGQGGEGAGVGGAAAARGRCGRRMVPPDGGRKLEAADIFTIAQLVDRINGVGRQWHGAIRGLGAVKGARLVAWLHENRAPLQLTFGSHVEVKRSKLFKHELTAVVQSATDIRPIEKFIPPEDLDGRAGVYRRPQSQCLLKATTDYAAVLAWLRAKRGPTPAQKERAAGRRTQRSTGVEGPGDWLEHLSKTQRAYRTEAERFVLWATLQKRKALSSLTHEDCIEYRDFLADPQPRSRWRVPRSRPRCSPLWRPFEGPLGIVAQRRAIMVLRNLFSYLQDQAYLVGNAWSHITVPNSTVQSMNVGRAFTQSQWKFLNERAAALGSESASLRLRLALSLFYATGLRISEAVAAQVDHLNWVEYPGESDEPGVEGFELTVVGKGDKWRVVPVPDDVITLLKEYLVARGLKSEPSDIGNLPAFLIGRLVDAHERAPNLVDATRDGRLGISATTLGEQIKHFFENCSRELLAAGDVRGAERFGRATTHWLRPHERESRARERRRSARGG